MIAAQEQPEVGLSSVASLYVGDLNPDVTEAMLYQIFGGEEVVTSTKVCRDMSTKKSLGYAYVNFRTVDDAKSALEAHNYEIIKDRPCRIMWSSRDPSRRKDSKGNLFIKNIDKSVDAKTIYQAFVEFGEILSFKMVTDDFGNSKGYGFIHFATEEESQKVVEKVNGILFNGKKLVICPFINKKDRAPSAKGNLFTNVFTKNYAEDMSVDELVEKFGEYGKVGSTFFPMMDEGQYKGFGFVCFEDSECALKATEALHGLELKSGAKLFAQRAMKKNERAQELLRQREKKKRERWIATKNCNCYVKNLPDEMSDDDLFQLFSKYGEITSCKIMRDEVGNSKKFGFVCFANDENASTAVKSLVGYNVGKKNLYVSIAQTKDERRYQLAFEFSKMKQLTQGVPQVPMMQHAQYAQYPPDAPVMNDMRRYRPYVTDRNQVKPGANPLYVSQTQGMMNAQRMVNAPNNFQAPQNKGRVQGGRPNAAPMSNVKIVSHQEAPKKAQKSAVDRGLAPSRELKIEECMQNNKFVLPADFMPYVSALVKEAVKDYGDVDTDRITMLIANNRDVLKVLERPEMIDEVVGHAIDLIKKKANR